MKRSLLIHDGALAMSWLGMFGGVTDTADTVPVTLPITIKTSNLRKSALHELLEATASAIPHTVNLKLLQKNKFQIQVSEVTCQNQLMRV
jgi:hypothetical protein